MTTTDKPVAKPATRSSRPRPATKNTRTPVPKKTASTSAVPAVISPPSDDLAKIDLDLDGAELPELAAIANHWHVITERSASTALEAAWHCGAALIRAKTLAGHGNWAAWLEANFDGSERSAQLYMQVSKAQRVADLDPEQSLRGAAKALSKSNAKGGNDKDDKAKPLMKFDDYLKRLKALGEVTPDVHRQLGTLTRTKAEEYAGLMQESIDPIKQLFDWICDMADRETGAA
jgi:Protein of unknown function (DUF3102)